MKPNCYLHALSSYVPAEVLTNDDLSKLVETNDRLAETILANEELTRFSRAI